MHTTPGTKQQWNPCRGSTGSCFWEGLGVVGVTTHIRLNGSKTSAGLGLIHGPSAAQMTHQIGRHYFIMTWEEVPPLRRAGNTAETGWGF